MRIPVPVVRQVLASTVKPVLGPRVPVRVQRGYLEAAGRSPLPAGTSVRAGQLGGRPSERVTVAGAGDGGSVLLLHGGAFLVGSPVTHRGFAAHLAAATARPVHVPHYRLAPEHPHPAALEDAVAAFDELATHGPVTVVGDSAGGTLALLLALRLRDRRRREPDATQPDGLGLVSPLVDLTLESARSWTGPDPLLQVSWVERGVSAFLAGADAAALSPLSADLTGLPPTVVHVSQDECLRPEGEALIVALRAAGVGVQSQLLAGLWHDAHLQAGLVGAAAGAVRALGDALPSGDARRSAVVTGAGRGIGRAVAERFLAAGWRVGAFDVDEQAVRDWSGQVTGPGEVVPGRLDVTDEPAWSRVLDGFGPFDVLVNSAGVLSTGPFAEIDAARQAGIVDVNVKGVLFGCAAASRLLRPGGVVVNLSSASALYGQPGLATYSATKAAVSALTEALDLEWSARGLRVVDVLPLFVATDMGTQVSGHGTTKTLGIRLTADDVAEAVHAAALAPRSRLRGPHRAVGLQTRLFAASGHVSPPALTRWVVGRLAR